MRQLFILNKVDMYQPSCEFLVITLSDVIVRFLPVVLI